jgi:hypothetical protein
MPTEFTATIWPPLEIVDNGENTGKGGNEAAAPAAPPNTNVTTAAPSASVNWTPAAPQPIQTTYVPPLTSQRATNTFFHIVDSTNGTLNPITP